MESLCGPYSPSVGLRFKCYNQLAFAVAPAVFWLIAFAGECLLRARGKSSPGKVPAGLILLLCLVIAGYFGLLSLELFYLDIEAVSPMEVLAYLVPTVQWTFIMYLYQRSFDPHSWGFTTLSSLRLFYGVQFAIILFQFLLWTSTSGAPQPLSSGGERIDPALQDWLQLLPWACHGALLGYLVSGWVQVRMKESSPQFQQLPEAANWFDHVSIYAKLTIWWIMPLLKLGRRKPLTPEDVGELRPEEDSKSQDARFREKLEFYLSQANCKRPILKAIIQRFQYDVMVTTAYGAISTTMDYVGSFYILTVSNYLTSDQPPWRGYVLITYLLLFKLVQGVCNTQFRFQMTLFSLHLKAALSTQIYNKSLKATTTSMKASGEASEKASYAQITNLMQVDLERIAMGIPYSLRATVWPFQIVLGIYMMFVTLGTAGSFAALGTMVVLFCINGITSKKIGQFMKLIMEKKDGRMKYCVELLSNIKVLKMYNWENKIVERISKAREEEVRVTRSGANWFNFIVFLNWGTRNYLIMAIVITMTILGQPLSPGNIFAGITVISILNMSIRFLPDIINNFIQLLVSMNRIEEYLKSQEAQDYNERNLSPAYPEVAVLLKEASFSYSTAAANSAGELPELKLALQDVSLTIKKGEFVAVVGRVGCGKSSLLQGIIGNMNFVKRSPDSHMMVSGSLAYVSQEAWIQNLTIKDNILFGNPIDQQRYQSVLDICELNSDLAILPGSDMTEIGEKGINLSGGQKARVAIARAVYADTDILLLDDPLSALDAHVGKSIFTRCLTQYCAGKTRILTTHGQQYLPGVDRIIVVNEGRVVETGTYTELLALDGYFKNEFLVKAHDEEADSGSSAAHSRPEASAQQSESKIIENEDKAVGSVSASVYKKYYRYMGGCRTVFAILLAMICWQAARMYADIYLSQWTEQSPQEQSQKAMINNLIFGVTSVGLNMFVLVRLRFSTIYGLQAAQVIFTKMIRALADAPINKYFDVTPNGRILNRLSKDQGTIDGMIIMILGAFIGQFFTVVLVVMMCAYAIPYLILVVPILVYLSLVVQKLYLASSRELTRLESISRSPIIQLFSETVSGAPVIRAFGFQSRFQERNFERLNENMRIGFFLAAVNGWLTVILELISDLVLSLCAFAIIGLKGSIDVGLAGMAMSYALSLPENFYWLVFTSSALENCMVSVERTEALTHIDAEAPRKCNKDSELLARKWPDRGEIEFANLTLKYREDTEIVLKGITARINSHENVGIVGRTGSGKSSLCLALFRIVEAYSGAILIDGVNISEVGLDLLRQRMSVIPQDPTLFRGKLRDNLDPFHAVSDETLARSIGELEMFQGKPPEEVLNMDVQENGENFSQGERQLICILRAILRNTKIMFLDEATASIDYRTDQMIQTAIREKFRTCTVLTIAHRINTIMDYDRVMVMEKGNIVEFDSPAVLKAKGGVFARLVSESRL